MNSARAVWRTLKPIRTLLKENPLRRNNEILITAIVLALIAAGCQSSPNTPPKANSQPAIVASIAPPSGPGPAPWPPAQGGEVWRSETTGKDYRVKIDGGKFYAEWANPSPVAAAFHSYIRTQCVRKGSRWVGTSEVFLPCAEGNGIQEHIANSCHLTVKFEIDSISKNLITGHTEALKSNGGFDCQSCKVLATEWASFKWVPAKQKTEGQASEAKKH